METFYIGTKIITGPAVQALEAMHIERLLIVSDPFFAANGTAKRLSRAAVTEVFDQVAPDPSLTLAARGVEVVNRFRPHAVLALGGGSAIDCAKAMVYFSQQKPTLIAVPTTSGSGSEVTDFAILTHEGIKHPLVDESLRPDVAILDGQLLEKLPPKLIADGGMDLISHALEAIAATGAGQISDCLAAGAFCTALSGLKGSLDGDTTLRQRIHTAATMAGLAFSQAGLGLCHAMSHALGGELHLPHGRLNAILLPAVLDYNTPAAGSKYAALARQAGLSSATPRALKNALIRLRQQLQMPATLAQAGADPQQVKARLEPLAQAAAADPCCATNPVPVTPEGIQKLLREVTGYA